MIRIKVIPVRAITGRIQGWAVNQGAREIAFFTNRIMAMDMGNFIARDYNRLRELSD